MGFLDRLRTTNLTLPLNVPAGDLGDASPQHYLTDDPEADSPSDPWRYGFTRRRFLQGGAAAALGCAELSRQLVTSTFSFRPANAAEVADDTKTLIVLFLRGGIDGLNVVVPHGDPVYYDLRPQLAIPKQSDQLIDLGDGMFGLNAVLQPLKPLWDDKKLAIAHAVASPEHNRSHFEAMRIVETAGSGTGYLDRYMQLRAERSAFSAVSMEGRLPQSMSGPSGGGLALGGSVDNFRLRGPDPENLARVIQTMYDPIKHPASAQVASTMGALETASMLTDTGYEPQNGAQYPEGGLGGKLREVARLLRADVGLQVAAIDAGGFDTHTNERVDLDRHLTDIGAALGAFATDLGDDLDKVTLVTMSEFGRRIEQNNNNGTDHGWANFMFMLGGGVKGGKVYTTWPGLDNDNDGDLAQAVDYRSVLGEWMLTNGGIGSINDVFPNLDYDPVNFT